MYRLVVIDEKLEQFGIHGRFIRAYLSTHLLAHFERHASQETKQRNFFDLEINETKLRLLLEDVNRTANGHKHVHVSKPSSLLRSLAALELISFKRVRFCTLPENWENFILSSLSSVTTEEDLIGFIERKTLSSEEWPFPDTAGTAEQSAWAAKVWQAWESWVFRYGGDEDKALWKLQVATFEQLMSPKPTPTQPPTQPRLFDFTPATAATTAATGATTAA